MVMDRVYGLCLNYIPVIQFQWFLYTVSYLPFFYRGDGFDSSVAARKSAYKKGAEDKG